MASVSELGEGLLGCLREVSGLLVAAHAAADEERTALVDNDTESLLRSCRAQDEALRRITEADQRAAELATRIAEGSNMDPDAAGPSAIAEAAGPPFDRLIPEEMGRIARRAEQLKSAHEVNKKLLNNGLEIVASCLRMLANDAPAPAYSGDAALLGSQPQIISLDSKA
jgi:hypothetical protein